MDNLKKVKGSEQTNKNPEVVDLKKDKIIENPKLAIRELEDNENTELEDKESIETKNKWVNHIKKPMFIILTSLVGLSILLRIIYLFKVNISFSVLFGLSTIFLLTLPLLDIFIRNKVLKILTFTLSCMILSMYLFDSYVLVNQLNILTDYKGYKNEKIINKTSVGLGNRFETELNKEEDLFTGYVVDRNDVLQIEKSIDSYSWKVVDKIKDKVVD